MPRLRQHLLQSFSIHGAENGGATLEIQSRFSAIASTNYGLYLSPRFLGKRPKSDMSPNYLIIIAMGAVILWVFLFVGIWASRYAKVAPNQVLVVSGRKYRLPDGTSVGFRIVKGGGTFVFPVIERLDVLSLGVFTIEMPKAKIPSAQGVPATVDCVARAKIKGDDVSIFASIQHFLSKKEDEIKNSVWLVLEKHLRAVFTRLSTEEINRDLAACATNVEAAASADLAELGVTIVSFTIRGVRAG
jgi:flotillin